MSPSSQVLRLSAWLSEGGYLSYTSGCRLTASGSRVIEAAGEELFALACNRDLEGIVAKHKFGPYLQDAAQWFKIRNRKYSQWAGWEKFFGRDRDFDPDIFLWDSCVFACENA